MLFIQRDNIILFSKYKGISKTIAFLFLCIFKKEIIFFLTIGWTIFVIFFKFCLLVNIDFKISLHSVGD